MLALESARLETQVPLTFLPEEEGTLLRERYAPMLRLLVEDDQLFLARHCLPVAAKRLRREHRHCYFDYLARLTREIRTARKLGALAMASKENWSFWVLLEHTVILETSLLYLRWLGHRHATGINVAARDVGECLDFLLAGPKFRLASM